MARPKRQKIKVMDDDRASRGLDGPSEVAAAIRAARARADIDLYDAAEKLHIRYPYLEAIEEGRFDDLPGPAYALGFVRAYAQFLGLDGNEIVRQFKEEGQGLSRRQALVFPEPLQEGRFPSGRVLITAVVLAGAVYGGWSYWQHRHANQAERVSLAPPNLAALVRSGPPSASEAVTTTPAPTPGAAPNTTPSAAQASNPAGGTAAKGTVAESTAAGGATAGTGPQGEQASGANSPVAAVAPAPENPAETGVLRSQTEAKPSMGAAGTVSPGTAPASIPTPASKPAETATAVGTESPAVPQAPVERSPEVTSNPASPAPEQVASKPNAQIYGETGGDSRVTLSATQDSWVQVRDKNDAVIWTRILRAGESYMVPNQAGLTLVTGNAGALKVTVDGKTAPPLGPLGAVRRNISLDPDKLAAGTAVGQ